MDFAAGVYLVEAQDPIPPPYTVYVYKVYLFTRGRGGESLSHRVNTEWQWPLSGVHSMKN
jgi:hypothetical protein